MEVVHVVTSPSRLRQFKRFLWNYAPPLFYLARAIRTGLHQRRERRSHAHLAAVQQAFIARYGLRVQSGPFRGMRYVRRSHGSALLPKLVGSYEAELHHVIRTLVDRDPATVIDVGCAEGYYAVGLALRLPRAVTYAFDIAAGARERCRELAERNGVEDRVFVEGECTPARLQELLGPRSLVVCDCEGAEVELLDPEEAPALRMADLLVELHDDQRLDVDVTATLVGRFRESHDVTLVRLAKRDPERYPVLSFLAPGSQRLALHEDRTPEQQWLFLTPKPTWADSGVAGDLDEDGAFAVAEGEAGDGAAEGAVGAQGAIGAAQLEASRRG
jgi:hypothetical protein